MQLRHLLLRNIRRLRTAPFPSLLVRIAAVTLALGLGTMGSVPLAQGQAPRDVTFCPTIKMLGSIRVSDEIQFVSRALDANTVQYEFMGVMRSGEVPAPPPAVIPGLIAVCVYPPSPEPGMPTSFNAIFDSWSTARDVVGAFIFKRPRPDDATNVPYDGLSYVIGQATWSGGHGDETQHVLVFFVKDPLECNPNRIPGRDSCFRRGNPSPPPPPPSCPGDTPACKQVTIRDANWDMIDPNNVPVRTRLFLEYNYVISNSARNTYDMVFNVPGPKTNDVNSGGGKDYFGCEQIPDPSGVPGAFGIINNFLPGWQLDFRQSSGTCNQSRFFLTVTPSQQRLRPGESLAFTINMTLRVNPGGRQEFTSCGTKFLNSGFTVKWFNSVTGLQQSFTTNPVLSVRVVGC